MDMANALGRKYINLLLSLGILLMIMLVPLAFFQIKQLNNANQWVIHSHEVIEETGQISNSINDTERTIQVYFITHDNKQISNFVNAFALLQQHIYKLKNLTKDNVDQQISINRLVDATSLQKINIDNKIRVFRAGGIKEILKPPHTGAILSQQMREIIDQIITIENGLLHHRAIKLEHDYILINILILTSGSLSLIFLLVGILLLNQQISFRYKAESNLQKTQHELYKLAYYDPLTNLANRTMLHNSFADFLDSSSVNNQHMAILFIDLDNFKHINDSLGHEIGDSLLKSYAKRLTTILERKDIIARLGGDEFVVVLTDIKDQDYILNIAKNILYLMSEPFTISTYTMYLTSSIGISMYPMNGMNSHVLLKNADLAMYKAKELGKNNIQFYMPVLAQQAEEVASYDFEMHHALENNEFFLVYQPIISLKENRILSVEVLIRWQRPNNSVVYPKNFIQLAENNGLIIPIGDWTLRQACIESKKWISKIPSSLPIKVAVNVSSRQFVMSDFASKVTKILHEIDFDPSLLDLEITESVLFENSYNNLATLNALKDIGIKISIDDFGTGYSSLNYLRTFAIDKLKIDQSFIQDANGDNYTSRIIKSIINLAHDLNITVLAEGVETEKQMEFLKRNHCDEAQGFYYSHPLTAKELLFFLEQHQVL